ncbi:MAG TPA: helix-turn-helix domain-containing protein [Candidatus Tetragenococcus pullicola]|nr:helix-turn-helix domain-containing protein [Candidatus Tetragenococcus pullicola]
MNYQQLQKIYPEATLHPFPAEDEKTFYSIPSNQGFLWIPIEKLSTSEKQLLSLLTINKEIKDNASHHSWYNALFLEKAAPVSEGSYRIIQVEFHGTHDLLSSDWDKEIRNMLPEIVDSFFVTEKYGLLIERKSQQALTKEELEGLFLALDGDFNVYTRLFVGPFHVYDQEFSSLLKEEEMIFSKFLERNSQTKCCDLGMATIPYFADRFGSESYLMQKLYNDWFDEDMNEIIVFLWKNQGNVSSAAKDLFMHRNTLQYKIDKFQAKTGLNLKDMNDLFLGNFLVTTFAIF